MRSPSPAVIKKAEKLIARSNVREDAEHPDSYLVDGSEGTTRRVQHLIDLPGFTCDCPHGVNNPGEANCYHAWGVRFYIRSQEAQRG